ncbi:MULTISPECIES: class I SAM-dependent methyltransferase [Subtercola]|uniref:Demethylmenaquinone methyltransferase n=1 Tax=Subtercola vilae TaxID=2056433 RepID=A0A4T2C958_9MICO|nr:MULTISPECIES: class I SAM-dependent methyltransferase [Subtercola]MEA9984784.1 class I SAM-dependent methyltransferase [Subtercola sp. RTI3]TIH38988.1 class I SAM-dependent methyltransferase [Subtercola vilae]
MSKADLSKQPAQVSAMFDDVSTHYDRTNNVLSAGNALLWRVATTKAVAPKPGERILDLAAGTGTSSASLAASGATVVAADFSPGMIEVGKRQQAGNTNIEFLVADGMNLPFGDNEFDAVTISFGLRNIMEPRTALAELYRVTKPGGRIVICEFSTPPFAPIRLGYGAYLQRFMPAIAKLASSNPDAYIYLADSIKDWPNQSTLSGWMRDAGFEGVGYRNLTFGIVALHRGTKPASTEAASLHDESATHPSSGPTTRQPVQ